MIKTGVAGWDYKNWKGTVYPQREGRDFDRLEYLARYLTVFEINRTYYRPATPDEARSWLERIASHPEAVLTAKLPEQFVAPGKSWTTEQVKEARAGLDVLNEAGRLKAAVLQFAYSFKRVTRDGELNGPALEWLREVLAAFEGLPLFVEFRHVSWDSRDVLEELREKNVGWVNVDQPILPRDSLTLTSHATSSLGYLRMHGRNYQTWLRGQGKKTQKTAEHVEQRQKKTPEERKAEEAQKDAKFDYLYPRAELDQLVQVAQRLASREGVREVLAVYNNHNLGQAPANALMLASLLKGEKVAAPPELYETYPEALEPYSVPLRLAQ
jgi:uncharacterized protein YecE (DUF72 family)